MIEKIAKRLKRFTLSEIELIVDFGMGFDTSMKNELKPRIMELAKNLIGFC